MGIIFNKGPSLAELQSVTARNAAAMFSGELVHTDESALEILKEIQFGTAAGFIAYGASSLGQFLRYGRSRLAAGRSLLTIDNDGVLLPATKEDFRMHRGLKRFIDNTSAIPSLEPGKLFAALDNVGLQEIKQLAKKGNLKAIGLSESRNWWPRQPVLKKILISSGFETNISSFPRHHSPEQLEMVKPEELRQLREQLQAVALWMQDDQEKAETKRAPAYYHIADILGSVASLDRTDRGEEGRFMHLVADSFKKTGIKLVSNFVSVNPFYPGVMGMTPDLQFVPLTIQRR